MSLDALEKDNARLAAELQSITPGDFGALFVVMEFIEYKIRLDFFVDVLENHLVPIKGKPYDGPQVSNKYLHKDVVAALDRLIVEGKGELQEMGLWPFTLASAARTPMQQAALSNPIAAGMFSSGHVYGAAFDISVPPGVDLGKNWSRLNRLLGRFGLMRKEGLRTKDPNHVFLTAFVQDRNFSNSLRHDMLRDYVRAMEKERERQRSVKDALSKEGLAAKSAIGRLDKSIADANRRIRDLENQKLALSQANAKAGDKNQQIKNAVRAQRLRNEHNKEKRRDWNRDNERGGAGGDAYWERNIHEEFHSNDGRRECWGSRDTHESSRGDSWTRESVHCETHDRGGMDRLP